MVPKRQKTVDTTEMTDDRNEKSPVIAPIYYPESFQAMKRVGGWGGGGGQDGAQQIPWVAELILQEYRAESPGGPQKLEFTGQSVWLKRASQRENLECLDMHVRKPPEARERDIWRHLMKKPWSSQRHSACGH